MARLWSMTLTACVEQPVAKKVAQISGAENFNVLQNNGRIAHQVVDHVCLFFLVLVRAVGCRAIWLIEDIGSLPYDSEAECE